MVVGSLAITGSSCKTTKKGWGNMENINVVECLGYLASVLVAVSFLMKSINKLRFINMVGGAYVL